MSGAVADGLEVRGLRLAGAAIDVDAEPGTVLALLAGPGSGRGEAVAAIAGLSRPPGTTARVGGRPTEPARVGLMQQPARLLPELTAFENAAVPLLARGLRVAPEHVERVLASLALGPATHHNLVEQLSGGQQQRVAIARALVTASPLVCLDEPVTELDEASVESVLFALRHAADDGAVVLVATADRDLAARCDRVVEAGA